MKKHNVKKQLNEQDFWENFSISDHQPLTSGSTPASQKEERQRHRLFTDEPLSFVFVQFRQIAPKNAHE